MKKRLVLIAIVFMALVAVTMIYQTYATSSSVSSNNNVHTITLKGTTQQVTIPANSSKTVIYQITNTNKGVVQYGIAYKGTNISVKVYNTSEDDASGTIDYGENKFVKLIISNTGTTSSVATLQAVLGYENGGDLIVPSGYTLATSTQYDCSVYATAGECITSMYLDNKDKIVKNGAEGSEVEYQYATSVNLMNDRLGGTTEDYDAGNIRYYGASPNNYVYFNCDDYNNQTSSTCEKWRIIGVFDDKLKIVKEESIGTYAWDLTGTGTYNNNWHDSTLMTLLNNGYYNNEDDVSYYFREETDGIVVAFDIDFKTSNKGIKNDETRELISDSTWYLGVDSIAFDYVDDIYIGERQSNRFGNNIKKTWDGYVALMYPSDYGYAVDLSLCNQYLSYYNKCSGVNWLFNGQKQWLLSPSKDGGDYGWIIHDDGSLLGEGIFLWNGIYYSNAIYPTLYLNSEINITSGNGSFNDPYVLVEKDRYYPELTASGTSSVQINSSGKDLVDYKIYGASRREEKEITTVRDLPSGYVQVESIESTGTQYIDTGVIANQNTGMEISFLTKNNLATSLYGAIIGARKSSMTNEFQLSTYSDDQSYKGTLRYGTSGAYNAGLKKNVLMNITLKNSVYTNNSSVQHSLNKTFETPGSLFVFALNQNGSAVQHGSLLLFSLKLYNGDTLIRDFVPCYRSSDDVLGLYDLVENKFYTNAGTGEFLNGGSVPTLTESVEVIGVGDYDSSTGKYVIPVKVSNNVNEVLTNIYLDEPLRKIGEYVDYIDFKNSKVVRRNKQVTIYNVGNDYNGSGNLITVHGENRESIPTALNRYVDPWCNYSGAINWSNDTRKVLYAGYSNFGVANRGELQTLFTNYANSGRPLRCTYTLETQDEIPINLPNIPTLKGDVKIEVVTDVKPSNIEITYKGK